MVALPPIKIESNIHWEKPLDIFEQSFALECANRESLEKLCSIARDENDEMTAMMVAQMLKN